MGLRVYNTMTGKKEDFTPRDGMKVTVYVCGLTPSGPTHVGHLRPPLTWDVIRRYLEYRGYKVYLVQNFTDVDDKIIARARREGTSPAEVARRFSLEYMEVLEGMNIRPADAYPRVSEHIAEIVSMVEGLVTKGYGYVVDGDVYFDVERFPGYGKLSGRSLAEMKAGARVEVDERKKNPMDFALWKRAREGEPAWDSPWGPGRPGWHIECSAMSLKYLGTAFDFHGGGADLVFPHHENEIAQSEAYTGQEPFVRYWVHNGPVNMVAEKMSKSVGNIVTAREVFDRYRAEVVRFYLLQSHYRSPIEFGWERLEEARKGWERLENTVAALSEALKGEDDSPISDHQADEAGKALLRRAQEVRARFEEAMDDDFNTALGIGCLFDLAAAVNIVLNRDDLTAGTTGAGLRESARVFRELGHAVLGVLPEARKPRGREELLGQLVDLVVDIRQEARARKDWATADRIRERLGGLGISVEDTPRGPRWRWKP